MEHDTGAPADRGPDASDTPPGSDVISSGEPSREGGRPRWLLAVAGAAVVVVAATGAAAWAASTGHSSPGTSLAAATGPSAASTPAPTPPPTPGQRDLRDAPGGPGRPGTDGLRGALHGRVTVPDRAAGGSGTGFRDVLVQRGTVTAVSATSLTLRSADGFTATYRLTDQTQYRGAATSAAGLRTGQALAVVAGTDSAALQVRDVLPPATVRQDHRGLLGPEGSGAGPEGSRGGGSDPGAGTGTTPARPSGHLPMSAPDAVGGAAT